MIMIIISTRNTTFMSSTNTMMAENTTNTENSKARCRDIFLDIFNIHTYIKSFDDNKSMRRFLKRTNIEQNTHRRYVVARSDMNEIYEHIEHVYDSRIQDIEGLGIITYDMCHNKLMRKTFFESMKIFNFLSLFSI